jgi:hypothetical protein
MNRNPERAPDQPRGAAHPESSPHTPQDHPAARHGQRHRLEPPRMTVDRRWRFGDAVTAARQLSTGNAGG